MYPHRTTALLELEQGGKMNSGPWTAHCLNAAQKNQSRRGYFLCGGLLNIRTVSEDRK